MASRSTCRSTPAGDWTCRALYSWSFDDREPPASGFRPNLTVVVEGLATRLTFDEYLEASLAAQARALLDWQLIDIERTTLGGSAAIRTLGHHAHEAIAVVVEQWRLLDFPYGWTVTASCAAVDYPLAGDALRATAASFRLRRGGS